MKKTSLIVLLLGALLGAVNAEIITVQVNAIITYLDDNGSYFDESVFIGANLTMIYSYDTTASGAMSSGSMRYEQPSPNFVNITMGNYQFQNSGSFAIYVTDYTSDDYQVTSSLAGNNLPSSGVNMSLIDPTRTALSGFELPIPNLSDWGGGATITIHSGRDFDIGAQIDSIIVPEPATLSLLVFGGFLLRKKFSKF